jgi:hypothetical protein
MKNVMDATLLRNRMVALLEEAALEMVFGMKFSGFIAWWLWRSVYLLELPRLAKKLRVVIAWTLDLFFGRDITQIITLHDVQELSSRLARIRDRAKQSALIAAESSLDTSAHDHR